MPPLPNGIEDTKFRINHFQEKRGNPHIQIQCEESLHLHPAPIAENLAMETHLRKESQEQPLDKTV